MILNIRTVDYLAKAPNSSFITTLLLLRFEACFFATILSTRVCRILKFVWLLAHIPCGIQTFICLDSFLDGDFIPSASTTLDVSCPPPIPSKFGFEEVEVFLLSGVGGAVVCALSDSSGL